MMLHFRLSHLNVDARRCQEKNCGYGHGCDYGRDYNHGAGKDSGCNLCDVKPMKNHHSPPGYSSEYLRFHRSISFYKYPVEMDLMSDYSSPRPGLPEPEPLETAE